MKPRSQAAPAYRRKRIYVDGEIQGRLAAAMVVMEVALLLLACLYLYHAFGEIIDENLYVIHASESAPLLPRLARELGLVVVVCALVNTVALVAAHHVWARHVRQVLDGMGKRLVRVRALDLRPDPEWRHERHRHRLVELTERWIESERRRIVAVRIAAARLPATLPIDPDGRDAEEALAALKEAAAQLRHGSHAADEQRESG